MWCRSWALPDQDAGFGENARSAAVRGALCDRPVMLRNLRHGQIAEPAKTGRAESAGQKLSSTRRSRT